MRRQHSVNFDEPDPGDRQGESIQDAMNGLRQVLLGNDSTLSGAIKGEPDRLLVASYLARVDEAIDRYILSPPPHGQAG